MKEKKPNAVQRPPEVSLIYPKGTETRDYNLVQVKCVPEHDGGRPMEVNACILITHMVYL